MKKTKSKKYNLKKKKRNTFRKKRNTFRKKEKNKKTLKQSGGSSYLWGKNKRLFWIDRDIMVKLNDDGFSKTLLRDDIFELQLQQLAEKVNQKYPESIDKCKLYMLFSFLPHVYGNFYPFHPSFVLTGIDGNGDGVKDTKDISTTNFAYQGMGGMENIQFTRRDDDIPENIINSKNYTLDIEGENEALIYFGYFEDDEEAQRFSGAVTDRSVNGYIGFQKPYNLLTNNCQHYATHALKLLKSRVRYGSFRSASARWMYGRMIDIDLNQFGEDIKQYIDENSEKLEEYATRGERAIAKSMESISMASQSEVYETRSLSKEDDVLQVHLVLKPQPEGQVNEGKISMRVTNLTSSQLGIKYYWKGEPTLISIYIDPNENKSFVTYNGTKWMIWEEPFFQRIFVWTVKNEDGANQNFEIRKKVS